jgi:O-antigen ligase
MPLATPAQHFDAAASPAAQRRYAARSTLWLSAMRLLVPATSLTLMLSQTQYFTANPIADSVRWSLLGALCGMVVLRPRGRRALRKPVAADWFAIVFIAAAVASTIYSGSRPLTVQRSASTALLYIAVFWTVWQYADIVGAQLITRGLLMVTVLMFGASVVSVYTSKNPLLAGRFIGVFANPNAIGMLVSLYMPIATAQFLRTKKVSALLILLLLAGSLVFSGSRNGVLATSLGMLVMLSRIHAWKAWLLLAVSATIVYLTMPDLSQAGMPANQGISRLVTTDRLESGGGRVEAWQAAIPIIQQKIVFGYGFGTEDLIFQGMTFRVHRGAYIHNSYLGITYQLGLAGALILFFPLFALLIRRLVFHRWPSVDVAAYEGVLLAALVACFFESWIYSAGNAFAFPFWIFVMLLYRATIGYEDNAYNSVRRAKAVRVARNPYLIPRAAAALPRGDIPRFDPPTIQR